MQLSAVEALVNALSNTEGNDIERRLSLAHIHYWMGRMHYYHNVRREALHYFRSMLAEVQEMGDEELIAMASSMIGRILVHQGYFGQAKPFLVRTIAALERAANWTEYVDTIGYLGIVRASCGEYKAGVEEVQRALEAHHLTADAFCHCHLATMYILGGDVEQAVEESRAIVSVGERAGDRLGMYQGHGIRAWAESRAGHHEEAFAQMARQQALAGSLGKVRLITEDLFAAVRAEMAFRAGRPEEALTLAEEAIAYAQTVDGKFAEGLAQRVQGLALATFNPSRWEEVKTHLAASIQAFETGEVPLEVARTHREWALLCRDHDDLSQALFHLEQAAAQFEACGQIKELEQIRTLLVELEQPARSAD